MLENRQGGDIAAEERRALAVWLQKKGKPLPAELASAAAPVKVHDDLMPIWAAWHQLMDSRPVGMALGAIPWSELSRFCEDHEVRGAERRRWCRLLQAMDRVYLAHVSKRKEPRNGSDAGSGGGHEPDGTRRSRGRSATEEVG